MWADRYIEELRQGRAVTFRPRGRSIGDEGYGLEEYETVTHWKPTPEQPK